MSGENVLGTTADGQRVLGVARTIRLMRGQVVVRELDVSPSGIVWTPDAGPRQVKTHRGLVLGLGPPARLTEHPSSPEVPFGFEVGQVVQYHFGAMGTQVARTRAWSDGEPATWLTQAEIDAVWQCGEPAPADYGPNAGTPCERAPGHKSFHSVHEAPDRGVGLVWGSP